MNSPTTSDVTRWQDRENVVKVAVELSGGRCGVDKQTGHQRKTVFP